MCAGYDLRAYQCIFSLKHQCIKPFQSRTAGIAIAITRLNHKNDAL